jgi:predicted RNA binding protein YcfA (HicA-like mRNA interferase family)
VSERLPVVFGAQLIDVLRKLGWKVARQRGSHVRLKHQDRAVSLVVPTVPSTSLLSRCPQPLGECDKRRGLGAEAVGDLH